MRIVGIVGTNGAGKGTIVNYLVQKRGWKHYSMREFIVEEIIRRGEEVSRSTMRETANDLRNTKGATYIFDELLSRAQTYGGDSIIESIRTIAEANALLACENGKLRGIDADIAMRYERAILRNSETDHVSFEDFVKQEQAEIAGADVYMQNVGACMKMASVIFQNNGTQEELYEQVEKELGVAL